MTEATGQPSSAEEAVGESLRFPSPWKVGTETESNKDVPRFRVKVPASTLQDRGMPATYEPPDYLRLKVRRRKRRIRLTPRPVLIPIVVPGGLKDELLVPKALKSTVAGFDTIEVSEATQKAFRWYRLVHSSGPVFSTVASVVGALLVALGALWFKSDLGDGLVIAGIVLTVLSVAGAVVPAWRSPD